MMNQALVAIVTTTAFVVGISTPTLGTKLVTNELTGSSSVRRELYEEARCEEGGKRVSISSQCCRETMNLQGWAKPLPAWLDHNSKTHSRTNNHHDNSCNDEINQADWLSHMDKYCNATTSTTTGAALECWYDYWKDNYACHKQASDKCRRRGGKAVHSNLTMVCRGNMIVTIRNHMDCLGKLCSKHDIREFVLTYIDNEDKRQLFRHVAGAGCEFTEINGVPIDTMKRQDTIRDILFFAIVLIVAVFFGYLRYFVCFRLIRDPPEPSFEMPRVRGRRMLRTPNAYTAVKPTAPVTEFEAEFA